MATSTFTQLLTSVPGGGTGEGKYTLLLTLFAQPRLLGISVLLGLAGGPWGRDPFDTSDL